MRLPLDVLRARCSESGCVESHGVGNAEVRVEGRSHGPEEQLPVRAYSKAVRFPVDQPITLQALKRRPLPLESGVENARVTARNDVEIHLELTEELRNHVAARAILEA